MLVGVAGILFPLMPGSILIVVAALVWAVSVHQAGGWIVFALVAGQLATGAAVKYLVPGRRLQRAGVPARTLLLGGVLGLVGLFTVPFVGLPLGFVLGVYVSELQRGAPAPWAATVEALKAIGFGMLIEFGVGIASVGVWLVGVIVV